MCECGRTKAMYHTACQQAYVMRTLFSRKPWETLDMALRNKRFQETSKYLSWTLGKLGSSPPNISNPAPPSRHYIALRRATTGSESRSSGGVALVCLNTHAHLISAFMYGKRIAYRELLQMCEVPDEQPVRKL